jgi:hypothetical protein
MKTVLEKAIEDIGGYMTLGDKMDIKFISVLLQSYLPQEKLQIKQAFSDGEANVWDRHRDEHDLEFETPEDYFNQTFKDKNTL